VPAGTSGRSSTLTVTSTTTKRAYRKRFMTAHPEADGGISGSYYLPPESAARLQALFDAYARKQGSDDTRTQSVRNADVLIHVLVNAVTAELLVVVNAETLTDEAREGTGPYAGTPQGPGDSRHPASNSRPGDSRHPASNSRPSNSRHPASNNRPSHAGAGLAGEAGEAVEAGERTDAQIINWPSTRPVPHSWAGDCCPTCGRTTNRDIPGLLLSTGHPLPAPHIRRLARTSKLTRLVLDAPGKVVELGSSARLVPPAMRKAILATYDTCAYDSCPIPAKYCEMDHVHPWSTRHTTRLDDIAPACDHHNRDRAKHPHKYKAERQTDGRWRITSISRRHRN
jgi:hypothetical protein